MQFKPGDLLTTINTPGRKPIARVERVRKCGVIHLVNLHDCQTLPAGTRYTVRPDPRGVMRYRLAEE